MKEVKKSERMSTRRKSGLFMLAIGLLTLIPFGVACFYIELMPKILKIFILILFLFLLIWIVVPGIIILLKVDTNYNPNIKLKTQQSDLHDIYKPSFNIHSLPNADIQEMKYNGFIIKSSIIWLIIFNVLTLGLFYKMYYQLRCSDMPIIKEDDILERKRSFNLLPFYNVYWNRATWLRLIDRINFQYRIRNEENPISRKLTIINLILMYIPLIDIISAITIGSILVWQIQNAINELVEEKEYLNND